MFDWYEVVGIVIGVLALVVSYRSYELRKLGALQKEKDSESVQREKYLVDRVDKISNVQIMIIRLMLTNSKICPKCKKIDKSNT